jgi:hypothetical protein
MKIKIRPKQIERIILNVNINDYFLINFVASFLESFPETSIK